VILVGVLSLAACLAGGYLALTTWQYRPSAPPDACGLVPEAYLSALTPGHDPAQPSRRDTGYEAITFCAVDSPVARLWIAVSHEGFGPDGGPATEARAAFHQMLIIPEGSNDPAGQPTPVAAGDEAAYEIFNTDENHITYWFDARMGAYEVHIEYRSDHLRVDDMVDGLIAVGKEVLSQL
jgi:hypothetical protein